MKWMPTCREASALASRATDVRLSLTERLALRIHLAVCKNCSRFNRQLLEMRRLLRETPADDDAAACLTPEARARIESELKKKLGS
jgi:hypothetical protein